jgi:serine/threonine-protein kinase HipA
MTHYSPVKAIQVKISFGNGTIPVGRLALREHRIYFSYGISFLEQGLEISPFSLPLQVGVKTFDHSLFEGLPGVFNDSLPDGWGRLLLDRFVRAQGVLSYSLSPLDRLAMVGTQGLGALVYEPEHNFSIDGGSVDLDVVASQAQEVLEGSSS